jgi:hypothetical protein
LWLLRIGYYKLMRPKPKASDWVWILDHTVQIGAEKCLLILGVRPSELSRSDLVLSHDDVEPIALFPVTRSNGEVVFQQLEETVEKTGLPREILGDQGSDLKPGTERFRSLGARIPRGVLLIGRPGAVTRPSCRATSRAHWTRSSWATSAPWPSTRRQDG